MDRQFQHWAHLQLVNGPCGGVHFDSIDYSWVRIWILIEINGKSSSTMSCCSCSLNKNIATYWSSSRHCAISLVQFRIEARRKSCYNWIWSLREFSWCSRFFNGSINFFFVFKFFYEPWKFIKTLQRLRRHQEDHQSEVIKASSFIRFTRGPFYQKFFSYNVWFPSIR